MVTPENNLRNIRTASRNVAARLGVDPAALSYEERIRYNKELAAEILRYPRSFTDATLAAARVVADQEYSGLENASFSFAEFAEAYSAPAADLGRGAAEALSVTGKLLPLLALIALGIGLVALNRKANA